MRVVSITLQGFRSIISETTLRLRPELTCLIGANEHGKSNLLEALYLLDDGAFTEYDRNAHAKGDHVPALRFDLQLSSGDIEDVNAVLAEYLSETPEPDDEEQKKRHAYLQKVAKYFKKGRVNIEVTLSADDRRSVEIPSAVTYTGVDFSNPDRLTNPFVQWFATNLPTVRIFEPTAELADSITLEQLNSRGNLPFEGLLKLAGAWEDRELLFEDSTKGRQLLDTLGRKVTSRVKRIWSQGSNHSYRFDHTDGHLHLTIKDPVAFDVPSRRSLGFRSFLSFYLTLFAETEEIAPEGYVLLFDEPGIHLHPQGQKDLLAEIRKLARSNQIVYATHSPFMIDRNDPAATVLVQKGLKGKEKGTQINYKPWGANWAPLSGALGVSPADAFFMPERPLIVEGTSDKLYIATFMSLTRAATGADLNYLTLLDSDRQEDVDAMVRILLGSGREIVVLVDSDAGGRDRIKALKRLGGGERISKVVGLNLADVGQVSKPVSIEDLLPPDQWFEAMQQYVSTVLGSDHTIDVKEIQRLAGDRTMGRAAADYLASAGVIDRPKRFSKPNVAHLFCQLALTSPANDSPMMRLCEAIASQLELRP